MSYEQKELPPIVLPEKKGTNVMATITRIVPQTAGEVFTKKKGEHKGEFHSKFDREPTDPVYTFYGTVEGKEGEIKLGTVNAPRNAANQLFGASKLLKLLEKMMDLGDVKTLSGDLHELVGKRVPCTYDENGFVRLF